MFLDGLVYNSCVTEAQSCIHGAQITISSFSFFFPFLHVLETWPDCYVVS